MRGPAAPDIHVADSPFGGDGWVHWWPIASKIESERRCLACSLAGFSGLLQGTVCGLDWLSKRPGTDLGAQALSRLFCSVRRQYYDLQLHVNESWWLATQAITTTVTLEGRPPRLPQ